LSSTDPVDWEKLCSQDLWDDTPTFTHSSTWTTTMNNADTQYSMTWKEDSFDWLDGKDGWEDSINLSLPTNTKRKEQFTGEDHPSIYQTETPFWTKESIQNGLEQMHWW